MTRLSAALLFLACLALAACGPAPATGPLPAPTTPPAGVTLTDALGRTVHLDALPQRIATAGRGGVLIGNALFMFPQAAQRVAVLVKSSQAPAEDFLSVVDPTFAQKTVLDREANPEQVLAAHPDVVVLKSYLADQLGTPLERLGVAVVYVDLETPEQYSRDLAILGRLFGDEARAAQIVGFYQAQQQRVAQAVEELADAQRPRVLLLQYSDRGGQVAFHVPPAGWIQTTMVEQAGGRAIWKEVTQGGAWMVVSLEQIAAWDADQIYVINYFGDVGQTVAALRADPQWQALRAVQDGQLHAFPKDFYSWDQPDPRWILGLTWLARTMHPDRFTDVDIRSVLYGFFGQMYGLDAGTVQESILPLVQGDSSLRSE